MSHNITVTFTVRYQFYHDYIYDNDFSKKLKVRLAGIKEHTKRLHRITSNSMSYDNDTDDNTRPDTDDNTRPDTDIPYPKLIKDNFVELFSWSAIPHQLLYKISDILTYNGVNLVIDPCCGTAFHTYLFHNFCGLDVYSADLQDEPNVWTHITKKDGRILLQEIPTEKHNTSALLLSWIDYESLGIELLDLFKGQIVISIGNYEERSPNYINRLNLLFNCIEKYKLIMPWGLTEKIEIYKRL